MPDAQHAHRHARPAPAALRRDRWVLPLWVGGLVLLVATSAAATVGLYPDANTRIVAASAVNEAPSLVAVYGRIYDPSSLGAWRRSNSTRWALPSWPRSSSGW